MVTLNNQLRILINIYLNNLVELQEPYPEISLNIIKQSIVFFSLTNSPLQSERYELSSSIGFTVKYISLSLV